MGLDQYAYVAVRAGQRDEHYERGYYQGDEFVSSVAEPEEIAYWRKHPNLQGWMERLWLEKNPGILNERDAVFNGVELELTKQDIERLENDILNGTMAELNTMGFFYGNPSDSYYREQDLEFVREARFRLFMGLKVFYNSSW